MLGKLSLHEHRFEIEFYSRESRLSSFMSIPKVYGEATSNDNATILRFLVKGLHLKKGTTFFTSMNHYVFEVEEIFVFSDGLNLEVIKSVSIRTHHLDYWLRRIVLNSSNVEKSDTHSGEFKFDFGPHKEIILYSDVQSKKYVFRTLPVHFVAECRR